MKEANAKRLRWAATALIATLAVLPLAQGLDGTAATSSEAASHASNKTSVSGSAIEFFGPAIVEGDDLVETTLLETTIKTSPPTDLIFQVTLECALWTRVATLGNGVAESNASVKVWVELDGVAVPVSSDDTEEPGKVVFCDRTHRQTVEDLDDEDARIEQFLRTRTANAFNWVAIDVGGGSLPHTVAVKAELSGDAVGDAFSQAAVGHRTLIVEPIKLATGATI